MYANCALRALWQFDWIRFNCIENVRHSYCKFVNDYKDFTGNKKRKNSRREILSDISCISDFTMFADDVSLDVSGVSFRAEH